MKFLTISKKYKPEIYADGDSADWKINPQAIKIFSKEIDSRTVLHIKLAPGGGQAIKLIPIN